MAVTVKFDTGEATQVQVTDDTTLTCKTPAHAAGKVNVVVTTAGGASDPLSQGFEYKTPPPPKPTITSVDPASGTTAGGDQVTIKGSGFKEGA